VNRQLNWFSMTAVCLLATLLPICAAQASDTISATANLTNPTSTQSSPNQLIALRKKKRPKQKAKQKPKTTATVAPTNTSPTDLTQTAPAPTEVTPPSPVPPAPVAPSDPPTPSTAPVNQFSTNTKLVGEAVFGLVGASGNYASTTTFGYRVRLELHTTFTGSDLLTTRLQVINQGLPNNQVGGTVIPAGSVGWTDGTINGGVKIDALNYQFSLSPQTSIVLEANAGASNDFTDTVNPLLDCSDSACGSISLFGTRAPIYYSVQGTGVGIRHKLNDKTELSLGYLARNASQPTAGNGLLNGGYGAIAQVTFQPSDSAKVAATYVRAYNSDSGTGGLNANLGGNSDNFGVEGSFQVNPKLTIGGWVGYTNNQLNGNNRQIWNWAVTAAVPDLGGKGNLAGLLIGQEPWVAGDANNGITVDNQSGLHLEGFYQYKVSDNISITPGLIYVIPPDPGANNSGSLIGVVRTTLTF
jgi:Carbohydrate-selective porin, OprB family